MINIAKDFTEFPGGRFEREGPYSGEEFRKKYLVPILKSGGTVEIVLDGVRGYPSSFLEEAFGGLVRQGFSKQDILKSFQLVANAPGFKRFIDRIEEFLSSAELRAVEA